MAVTTNAKLRLGDVLIESGDITEEQMQHALTIQKGSGGKRIGEVLIESGIITEEKMLRALSKRLNLNFVSIREVNIDLDAVDRIPDTIARKYSLIATSYNNDILNILISDPLDYYAIEDVRLFTGLRLQLTVCKKADIVEAIHESYSEIRAKHAAKKANDTAVQTNAVSTTNSLETLDITSSDDDTPVVTLVNSAIYKAYSTGASDVHIEPFEDQLKIRIRMDGQIINYLKLSASLHASVAARIKILAGMDIAEKRQPQDGHFRAKLQDADINIRVSSMPTVYGEKLVLRFMDQNTSLDNSGTFGMRDDDYKKVLDMLQTPHGVIYVTGPTGSGKTTTLYMIMEHLAKKFINIATIEDPVERKLKDINQSQINELAGLTFGSGLRSILRQDPDIVMIGETRDGETANISVRAALTGHLVMSTLHTNDSVSTIVRLIDMGVEDYILSNSLVGVVAQRLVKKVCPHCIEEYVPDEEETRLLGGFKPDLAVRGKGCHNCNNTGYRGRIAVHEILTIDAEIRSMIQNKVPIERVHEYTKELPHFRDIRTSLQELVEKKVTSIEEMLRLTYFSD